MLRNFKLEAGPKTAQHMVEVLLTAFSRREITNIFYFNLVFIQLILFSDKNLSFLFLILIF